MKDRNSLPDELRKVEAAIQAQESLLGSGILPDEQIAATLEALRKQRKIYLTLSR